MRSRNTQGWRSHVCRLCLLAAFSAAPWPALARPEVPGEYRLADLKALERAFVDLAADVQPSVVAIKTYVHPNGRIPIHHSQGAGFILDAEGFIVTNHHVIAGADRIDVIHHSGLRFDAELVKSDVRSDLAVIKIDPEGRTLRAAKLGDATSAKVSQWVFACGNPFGLANNDGRSSVTFGAISALERQMTNRLAADADRQYYGQLIETSATINPGSSGGPLFNIDREVIGVVCAIETSSGVSEGHGFAIPVDKNTRRVLDTLKAGDEVRYGFLGVTVGDVERRRSTLVAQSRVYQGAGLETITLPDGPAAKAGLKPRDILIEWDGAPIRNSDHFVRLVGFTPVGTSVPVTFLRSGKMSTVIVTVSDRLEGLERTRESVRPSSGR